MCMRVCVHTNVELYFLSVYMEANASVQTQLLRNYMTSLACHTCSGNT